MTKGTVKQTLDAIFDIATLHHIDSLSGGQCGWQWVLGEVRRAAVPNSPLSPKKKRLVPSLCGTMYFSSARTPFW